ncbi:MAG TPA: hypothetical protein VFG54_13315 [Prolixibacteraceae bacterium]|nr:hypothetical protein [Prolixibacteraceae bacterium]
MKSKKETFSSKTKKHLGFPKCFFKRARNETPRLPSLPITLIQRNFLSGGQGTRDPDHGKVVLYQLSYSRIKSSEL